jgi:hypothetical protein
MIGFAFYLIVAAYFAGIFTVGISDKYFNCWQEYVVIVVLTIFWPFIIAYGVFHYFRERH